MTLLPFLFPIFGFQFALAASAIPAPSSADFQLVQSVPEETRLAHADLPFAKDVWLEMIRDAKTSIDLAQFYVDSKLGEALEPVLKELENAAARGVKLRILFSTGILKEDDPTLARLRAIPGTAVRIYDIKKLNGGIQHAKYWIIDGSQAFVGSQNLDWRALIHIHELGLRIRNPLTVQNLKSIFDLDWKFTETGQYPAIPIAPSPSPLPAQALPVELVASPPQFNPPGIRPALTALLELLGSARKSIRIQLLDYSPLHRKSEYWPDLEVALRQAAARGVSVELLVSHWNTKDPEVRYLKSLAVIPKIEVRITTVPAHSSGFIPFARVIHSKYMVVDDEVLWLGTSNWSKGYFSASRNIELILRQLPLARQGAEVFQRVWTAPFTKGIDLMRTYPEPKKQ